MHYPTTRQRMSTRPMSGGPIRLRVVALFLAGIVGVGVLGVFAVKQYNKQVNRCKAMCGHVVSVTTYGNTYIPGGYVNGKYVQGGSVSTSTTTTTCNDPRGIVLFGM